jgi:hypothetical protein
MVFYVKKKKPFKVSGHSKIPKCLPVLKQGLCQIRGETVETAHWNKSHRQDGLGRTVERLADGFGTGGNMYHLKTSGLLASFSEGTRLLFASPLSQWSRQ